MARIPPGASERCGLFEKALQLQSRLDLDVEVRLIIADVAKGMLGSGRCNDAHPGSALDPSAVDNEPDATCEHLKTLLLGGVVVRGNVAPRIGEDLGM